MKPQYVAEYRARMKAAGWKRVEFYLPPDLEPTVRRFVEKKMRNRPPTPLTDYRKEPIV
jgi:hypothetical protein